MWSWRRPVPPVTTSLVPIAMVSAAARHPSPGHFLAPRLFYVSPVTTRDSNLYLYAGVLRYARLRRAIALSG